MLEDRNRRRLTRYVVDAKVDVLNQITGEALGTLVDIHAEGLMLMGTDAVDIDHIYQVVLKPAGEAEIIGEFELGIDCLWLRKMEQGEHSWAGCKIIDASDDALEKVQKLIDLFGRQSEY